MGNYLPRYCLLLAVCATLVKGDGMGKSEDTRKSKQFERLYTAVLVLLVAILLLISIFYTRSLWQVKVIIAVILIGISGLFWGSYLSDR